jgi:hypothetical protein
VFIHANDDENDSITVLVITSAMQKKWPVFFVANGKIQRIE